MLAIPNKKFHGRRKGSYKPLNLSNGASTKARKQTTDGAQAVRIRAVYKPPVTKGTARELSAELKNHAYIDHECAPVFGYPFVNYSPTSRDRSHELALFDESTGRLWGTFTKSIVTSANMRYYKPRLRITEMIDRLSGQDEMYNAFLKAMTFGCRLPKKGLDAGFIEEVDNLCKTIASAAGEGLAQGRKPSDCGRNLVAKKDSAVSPGKRRKAKKQ